jgi:hypothetical protein
VIRLAREEDWPAIVGAHRLPFGGGARAGDEVARIAQELHYRVVYSEPFRH